VSTLVLAARADAKLVRSGSAVLSDPLSLPASVTVTALTIQRWTGVECRHLASDPQQVLGVPPWTAYLGCPVGGPRYASMSPYAPVYSVTV